MSENHPLSHLEFLSCLRQYRDKYLSEAERIFGLRDCQYEIGDISESEGVPCIYFPEGYAVKKVEIRLGPEPIQNRECEWARWQLAHECVHLIDPWDDPPTNVLEEGLATWFQNMMVPGRHNDDPDYIQAKQLVSQVIDGLPRTIRHLRTKYGIRIGGIEARDLQRYHPEWNPKIIHQITARFRS